MSSLHGRLARAEAQAPLTIDERLAGAKEELRRTMTPEEWQAFQAECAARFSAMTDDELRAYLLSGEGPAQ